MVMQEKELYAGHAACVDICTHAFMCVCDYHYMLTTE